MTHAPDRDLPSTAAMRRNAPPCGRSSALGLMRRRVLVEVRWLAALATHRGCRGAAAGRDGTRRSERGGADFSAADGERIKAIEATTNHDVKAVEYFIKEKIGPHAELGPALEFVHFALHKRGHQQPRLRAHAARRARRRTAAGAGLDHCQPARAGTRQAARRPCLSRTHGQTASPTTLGKEIANVVARLERQRRQIAAVELSGKINGAVGNYNAHVVAIRRWTGRPSRAASSKAWACPGTLHHADRTARLWWPTDPTARQYGAGRSGARCLGLHLLGYFRQKPGRAKSAPRPCRTRSTRSISKNAEGNLGLANAPSVASPRAADFALAARPHRLDRAAAHSARPDGHPGRPGLAGQGLGKADGGRRPPGCGSGRRLGGAGRGRAGSDAAATDCRSPTKRLRPRPAAGA